MDPEPIVYYEKETDEDYFMYLDGYYVSSVIKRNNGTLVARYEREYLIREHFRCLEGQINLNTGFGQEIAQKMSDPKGPRKWMEIGTWNGRGSTQCMLRGLQFREEGAETVSIVSIEADPFFYGMALENLQESEYLDKQLFLVNGRIQSDARFPEPHEIPDDQKKEGGHYQYHYDRERKLFKAARQIEPPFSPDAVILDGGEFTGLADWNSVPKEDLQYVFLDDINVYKNAEVYELLKGSAEWILEKEDRAERNGWALFRRKQLSVFTETDGDKVTVFHYDPSTSVHFQTRRQDISVLQTKEYGRVLFINGISQSSQQDEEIYHTALVQNALKACDQPPTKVCILGGGEGATAREVLKFSSVQEVTMIDWDEELVNYFRDHEPSWHQGSLTDPRVHLEFADVFDVYREKRKYDCVIIDLVDPDYSDPKWKDLLQKMFDWVTVGGVLMVNAGCDGRQDDLDFSSEKKVILVDVPSFGAKWSLVQLKKHK